MSIYHIFQSFHWYVFFKQFDMQLIHVNEVGTKGGSLRYYWARNKSNWSPSLNVKRLSSLESKAKINIEKFRNYETRIETVNFNY